ncbi:MAG: DNA-binding protein [Haloferacaceae archaeon]
MSSRHTPDPAYDVPADERPAATCDHCGRPFADRRAHDLHVGEVHADACTDAEREAHEAAREDERADLFYFHLKTVATLGAVYAVTVVLYMVALGSGLV